MLSEDLAPEDEGSLAEWLPINFEALDRGIEHYLGQLDAMGDSLSDLFGTDGMWVGLGGVTMAAAAAAVAFEWERRSRSRRASLVDGDGMIPSWFLESISRG